MVTVSPRSRALIELNIAGVIFGGTALFSKIVELSIPSVIGWRAVVATLALGLFAWWRRSRWQIASLRDGFLFALIGLLLALHWVTYFGAMRVSTIAIGMTALFTYPVITVLLEPLFFAKKLQGRDIATAIAVLIGVAILTPLDAVEEGTLLGIGLGILSALLFSLRVLCQKKYVQHYPSSISMAYQLIVTCTVIAIFWEWEIPREASQWWLVVLLGTVFTALPHTIILHCLNTLRAKTLGIVSCLQPVYGAVIAFWMLNEIPSWRTVIGGAIILSAATAEMLWRQED